VTNDPYDLKLLANHSQSQNSAQWFGTVQDDHGPRTRKDKHAMGSICKDRLRHPLDGDRVDVANVKDRALRTISRRRGALPSVPAGRILCILIIEPKFHRL
jgi:hypothetical protein